MPWIRFCRGALCLLLPMLVAMPALISESLAADAEKPIARLAVGDKSIDFDLPVVGGENFIELSDEYKQGPVVVVVLRGYPGYQCPLCNRQVAAMANRAKTLAKAAQRVILVYPGDDALLQRRAEEFMGSRTLPEPLVIVRDDGMKMVSEWGLRWDSPRESAYPATYVIDRNGRVRWSKVSDSHAGRSTVEEILRELRRL